MSTLFDFISIAIGLVFIFWLLSIITSYVLELISSTFALRAHNLADAIHLMLQPPSDKLARQSGIKVYLKKLGRPTAPLFLQRSTRTC
jgi:hypothetical protein